MPVNTKIYSYLLLIFCFCAGRPALAQTKITGRVVNQAGEPVKFSSVKIEHPATNATICFGLTNTNGGFVLTFNTDADSVVLVFNNINYQRIAQRIKNTSQQVTLQALPEVKQLKEVVVKTPPVKVSGDTITHIVQDYATRTDRTLADVLKNIPGIEVSENGKIKYLGQYITKFYVEGKDLMEQGYGIITKALPHTDAASIEILQNHQPIKVLANKVGSGAVAINVKLKKAVSFSGRSELGTGLSPFLRHINTTPMLFSKKNQALVSYQHNNTGDNLLNTDITITYMPFEGINVHNNTGRLLALPKPAPPLPEKRYLLNNDHLLTGNYLKAFKKKGQVKFNFIYINGVTDQSNQSVNTTILNNPAGNTDTIIYKRRNAMHSSENKLKGFITITGNTSKFYRNNVLSFETNLRRQSGVIELLNDPLQQQSRSPLYNFQNSLSLIAPLKKKGIMLNIMSWLRVANQQEQYQITPLTGIISANDSINNSKSLIQKVGQPVLLTIHSVNTMFKRNRIEYRLGVNVHYENNKLVSELNGIDGSEKEFVFEGTQWNNNFKYRNFVLTARINLAYNTQKWSFGIATPVDYLNLDNTSKVITPGINNINRIIPVPMMLVTYKLKKFWKLNFNYTKRYTYSPVNSIYTGNIFSGVDFYKNSGNMAFTNNNNFNHSINYNNPLKSFIFYMGINYARNTSEQIMNALLLSNGQQILSLINKANSNDNMGLTVSADKHFFKTATRIYLRAGINQATNNFYINEVFDKNRSLSKTAGLDFSSNITQLFRLTVKADITGTKNRNSVVTNNMVSVGNKNQLYYFISKKHSVNIANDYSYLQSGGQAYHNHFIDAGYQVSFPAKTLDIALVCNNILNQRQYTRLAAGSYFFNISNYAIRPRQVLIILKFNFR